MAILHRNITNSSDIHNPKWFPDSNNGDYAFKNEKGELESIDELLLPGALNFVDGSVAPPTTATGDIYILSSVVVLMLVGVLLLYKIGYVMTVLHGIA